MPYKAWLLPISCLTIHWRHRCQVLVCMSLGPKEDMLIPEIREHVSLTNDCGVSRRQDPPSPSIKVFLSNVYELNFESARNSAAWFSFERVLLWKEPQTEEEKTVLCAGMWASSDTGSCFTPTEAQLGLLLTRTREFMGSARTSKAWSYKCESLNNHGPSSSDVSPGRWCGFGLCSLLLGPALFVSAGYDGALRSDGSRSLQLHLCVHLSGRAGGGVKCSQWVDAWSLWWRTI